MFTFCCQKVHEHEHAHLVQGNFLSTTTTIYLEDNWFLPKLSVSLLDGRITTRVLVPPATVLLQSSVQLTILCRDSEFLSERFSPCYFHMQRVCLNLQRKFEEKFQDWLSLLSNNKRSCGREREPCVSICLKLDSFRDVFLRNCGIRSSGRGVRVNPDQLTFHTQCVSILTSFDNCWSSGGGIHNLHFGGGCTSI